MFLTLKELRYSKFKFSALAFIIFLIVFLVLFITGLANGLANDSGSALKNTTAKTFILQKDADARLNRSNLTEQDWQRLTTKTSDTRLSVNQATIQQTAHQKAKTDIAYFVVDANSFLAPTITSGHQLTNKKTNQVVVSRKLQTDGYQKGDWFKDTISGHRFQIAGFTTATAYSHSPVIYLNAQQGLLINPSTKTQFNAVVSDYTKSTTSGYQTLTTKQVISAIPGYSAEQSSLYLMIGFLYVISLFVLAIFFYIMTLQKKADFGVLKALGAQNRYLVNHLLTEIGLLALIAILIADGAIIGISLIMPTSMPFSLTPAVIGGTSAIFLVVAVLSALLSLIQVTRIDPISAIGGHA